MLVTTHKLDFEVARWITPEFTRFRIGTCYGLWGVTADTYDILVIDNDHPGNGHLEDVFQWFETSCRRDQRSLRVLDIVNERFYRHLIEKRGFVPQGKHHLIKHFK